MPSNADVTLDERLSRLEAHLAEENPVLQDAVKSFRKLDRVAYKLGLMDREESFATHISWWPLISVLGTFSSGKSTFINQYLGQALQSTGNQAVDDKFTVICYGRDSKPHVLPGRALDNEPRFPFYRISSSIEETITGGGQRVDVYLQLKTSNSERLRGNILIDSPGFDADAQRTAILRITEHIMDLSDLVLVFFDARHPEPGAMRDTLDYLVTRTMDRPDFNKFLYILNQIDTAAREDNPEQVVAAWQRALAQKGLTAGRFFTIYDPEAAGPIDDEAVRTRFEAKRETDMSAITQRMQQVRVERAYRITGLLEETATRISGQVIPQLRSARRAWKQRTLWLDALVVGILFVGAIASSVALGYWSGVRFQPAWASFLSDHPILLGIVLAVIALVLWFIHAAVRGFAGRQVLASLRKAHPAGSRDEWLPKAFATNIRSRKPIFAATPCGYGRSTRKALDTVQQDASRMIQQLNDRYTSPSGPDTTDAPDTTPPPQTT